MNVETRLHKDDSVYVIGVNGKFDSTVLRDFRKAYSADEAKTEKLVIDMANTLTLDSSALGILLCMQQYLGRRDGEISIVNCNDTVMKIFEITNFSNKFNIG